ncbi:Disulfide bond reductase DsbH precursor [Candidatus Xiphinematobacter sp. Idaho Grape]|uniref:thioredoxin family protein n=1 Tax=Candidatus Xiphinematobacter sp. Idaho Grape TaxID=1704307 RepID=UPI000706C341|nr:thioredoxin family protein [Candidatus Xiphinematobacter sp. Idaho Grape]ALJ56644.1 Disulfide bond reductase DsbH precursor [Candidatus Xiphinematobacter sp. Idaho Grape]
MKRYLLVFLIASLATTLHAKFREEWQTDYRKALKQARTEHKQVLLNFTGSDWCGWCIRLKKEVFDQPEFIRLAEKHLVLVEVDFPQSGSLPRRVLEQNKKLRRGYCVEEFPTLVLLDCNGKKLKERTGYMEGGVAEIRRWIHAPLL